ncbi:MAG: hypothetical protein QNJ47_17185 [Nostocaceae cyanobacterium]|nr:hypothetical protein [Nostocaceae cyanobacterium]
MGLKIGFLIEPLRNWFPKFQAQIKSQATELEQKFIESSLDDLPQEILTSLKNNIDGLFIPQIYQDTIESQLTEALALWQEQEDAANSLVILGNPVEQTRKIINETFLGWQQKHIWQVKSLSWKIRPENHSTILPQLQQEIELSSKNHSNNDSLSQRKFIVIIPDLSYCFLRCVDGLEAIDYIQEMVVKYRSIFWLIGCNNWAWQYLDCACKIGAYFENTYSLPTLKDIEIKDWLNPILQTIDLNFNDSRNQEDDSKLGDDEREKWNSKSEKKYFGSLADMSLGISTIAAQLWLRSLAIKKKKSEEDENENTEIESNDSDSMFLQWAKLPDLPNLTKDDLYLLFSLCLHNTINVPDLALSLGEPESRVQAQVQVLKHVGIIEQKQGILMLNPVYYPRLKRHLVNNHFLVVGDS